MSNLTQNILLPKNNTAFKRLLQANPELINNYIDELVSFNGGAYSENIDSKEINKITQSANIIGNAAETVVLLRSSFIGIN